MTVRACVVQSLPRVEFFSLFSVFCARHHTISKPCSCSCIDMSGFFSFSVDSGNWPSCAQPRQSGVGHILRGLCLDLTDEVGWHSVFRTMSSCCHNSFCCSETQDVAEFLRGNSPNSCSSRGWRLAQDAGNQLSLGPGPPTKAPRIWRCLPGLAMTSTRETSNLRR